MAAFGIEIFRINKNHFHEKYHHCGRDQTLTSIKEEFWVINGKSVVNCILNNCLLCRRLTVKPKTQFMSDLPAERLAIYEPAFSYTEVDYFGPITLKQSKNQEQIQDSQMLWCSVYMFNYHSSTFRSCRRLSKDCFILALRRFIT